MELISSDTQDIQFMRLAIAEARKAELLDEVPIGAAVVRDGEVIAAAYNRRETDADPAGHGGIPCNGTSLKQIRRLASIGVYGVRYA